MLFHRVIMFLLLSVCLKEQPQDVCRVSNKAIKPCYECLFLLKWIDFLFPSFPPFFIPERYYWGSKLRIPTVGFEEVLRDDKAALDWLTALRRVGMVHLKGAQVEKGQVVKLAERVGYLRLTFYG